jgi:hypothetical protein
VCRTTPSSPRDHHTGPRQARPASILSRPPSRPRRAPPNRGTPAYVFRHRVEAAFPLSDTADHDELIAFIEETGAREIYLSSGFIDEVSEALRGKGLRVYSLIEPQQLTLF